MVILASTPDPGRSRRASTSPATAGGGGHVGRYFLPTPGTGRRDRDRRRRCYLCASVTHESRDCPQECCWRCGTPGHQSKECRGKGSTMVVCSQCRRFGHIAAACMTKPSYTADDLARVRCMVCGERGHLDCTHTKDPALRLFCYNCGQRGHFGEDCGRPGMDVGMQRRIVAASLAVDQRGGSRSGFTPPVAGRKRPRSDTDEEPEEEEEKDGNDELTRADRLHFNHAQHAARPHKRARSPHSPAPGGRPGGRAANKHAGKLSAKRGSLGSTSTGQGARKVFRTAAGKKPGKAKAAKQRGQPQAPPRHSAGPGAGKQASARRR